MKAIDVTGMRFGRLCAIDVSSEHCGRQRKWVCKCDCGNITHATSTSLRSGDTASCGCLRREMTGERGRAQKKHGLRGTREYSSWVSMTSRCSNPGDPNWEMYGGRGIQVCERWMSFESFLSDLGKRPTSTSIDRIDSNGNYEPTNCRWATPEVQSNNKRNNRFVDFEGQRLTIAQWARAKDMSKQALIMRLNAGWEVKRALTQPIRFKGYK